MANTVGSTYGKVMFDNEGVLATWFPDRTLRVGDVVARSADTGILTVETTFADLVEEVRHQTVTHKGPESVVLQRGVSITVDAQASAAGATADLTFEHKSSFVFAARTGQTDEYERLANVRSDLLALHLQSKWNTDWQLVTAVRTFKTTTIIVARENGTAARVSLQADNQWTGFEAVSASAGLSITRGDAAHWELKNPTPLYEAVQVQPAGLFRGTKVVEGRYLDDQSETADPIVVRATPHDLSA